MSVEPCAGKCDSCPKGECYFNYDAYRLSQFRSCPNCGAFLDDKYVCEGCEKDWTETIVELTADGQIDRIATREEVEASMPKSSPQADETELDALIVKAKMQQQLREKIEQAIEGIEDLNKLEELLALAENYTEGLVFEDTGEDTD